MTECVFTLDYEIYGNGKGSLRDIVIEPTRELAQVFADFDAPFVVFAEALEFAMMEGSGSDPDVPQVAAQLRELRAAGHEIALHLHPWWANARYENGAWRLDWRDRNICTLPGRRVEAIVSEAIGYLRKALEDPRYTPLSFRSGLWAMQPTRVIAEALVRHGVRVDSSVFHGGRIRSLGLDYRKAPQSGRPWRFTNEVTAPDRGGSLMEIPIHTRMVPFWRMLRSKRLKLHRRVPAATKGNPLPRRWRDFLRLRYPAKLDFCRMTFDEMRQSTEEAIDQHGARRGERHVIVAIGHSKDFVDAAAIRRFLDFLRRREVAVTTFAHLLQQELLSHAETHCGAR